MILLRVFIETNPLISFGSESAKHVVSFDIFMLKITCSLLHDRKKNIRKDAAYFRLSCSILIIEKKAQ